MHGGKSAPAVVRSLAVLAGRDPPKVLDTSVISHVVDVIARIFRSRFRADMGKQYEVMYKTGVSLAVLINRDTKISVI